MLIGVDNSDIFGNREKSKGSDISVSPQYARVLIFVMPKMWGLVEDNENGRRMNLKLVQW